MTTSKRTISISSSMIAGFIGLSPFDKETVYTINQKDGRLVKVFNKAQASKPANPNIELGHRGENRVAFSLGLPKNKITFEKCEEFDDYILKIKGIPDIIDKDRVVEVKTRVAGFRENVYETPQFISYVYLTGLPCHVCQVYQGNTQYSIYGLESLIIWHDEMLPLIKKRIDELLQNQPPSEGINH